MNQLPFSIIVTYSQMLLWRKQYLASLRVPSTLEQQERLKRVPATKLPRRALAKYRQKAT